MKIRKIRVIEPIVKKWVLKHKGIALGWLIRPIINQMAQGGIKYAMINRWLVVVKHPVIVGYMVMPNKEVSIYFKVPSAEYVKNVGGRYVPVC